MTPLQIAIEIAIQIGIDSTQSRKVRRDRAFDPQILAELRRWKRATKESFFDSFFDR